MRPFHYAAILCVLAAAALAVAGYSAVAGWARVLGAGEELMGAVFTGKQENGTER